MAALQRGPRIHMQLVTGAAKHTAWCRMLYQMVLHGRDHQPVSIALPILHLNHLIGLDAHEGIAGRQPIEDDVAAVPGMAT